jgi:hypothetical protein
VAPVVDAAGADALSDRLEVSLGRHMGASHPASKRVARLPSGFRAMVH